MLKGASSWALALCRFLCGVPFHTRYLQAGVLPFHTRYLRAGVLPFQTCTSDRVHHFQAADNA
jgi:hypothetical protein